MKSSVADTSRERKTDVNTESTPPPKKTRIENETEIGAETRAETEEVKEVIVLSFSSKNFKLLLVITSHVRGSLYFSIKLATFNFNSKTFISLTVQNNKQVHLGSLYLTFL